uniref:Uncharacterized protein n=1 Tax=Aegilops tauschii subsp. strangulata TaxID=200361 RepID=A0A453FL06_AEGTS
GSSGRREIRSVPTKATRHNTSRPTHAPFALLHGASTTEPKTKPLAVATKTHPQPTAPADQSHGAHGGRQGRGRLRHARAPP